MTRHGFSDGPLLPPGWNDVHECAIHGLYGGDMCPSCYDEATPFPYTHLNRIVLALERIATQLEKRDTQQ